MTSTFTFITSGSDYIYKINSNLVLRLYRNNHSFAKLEVRDEMDNKINIPPEIIIYTKNYQNKEYVVHPPIGNIYALSCRDDYQIEFNKNLILHIKNNRFGDITIS